jgi:serine protease Do
MQERLREQLRWMLKPLLPLLVLLSFGALAAPDISNTIERVKPSIVAVGTYQKTRSPPFAFRGTGFVVGDGTLAATNAHVVPEKLAKAEGEVLLVLAFAAGGAPQPREAKVVALDHAHDIALMRISGASLHPLELDDTSRVREGQSFAFTGFPIGHVLGFSLVTHRAMISSITPIAIPRASARELDEKTIGRIRAGAFTVFQLDATAYPGNSGSPLYDPQSGRVVGVINMVLVRSTRETALSQPTGITFAVPVRHLQALLSRVQ